MRSLRSNVGHDAVNSDGSESQCQAGEDEQQQHEESSDQNGLASQLVKCRHIEDSLILVYRQNLAPYLFDHGRRITCSFDHYGVE